MRRPNGMKILVADDDRGTVEALRIILKRLGHDVTEAYDGKEALKFIKEGDFKIAFVDNNMPELSGIEVSQYVKQHELNVKVIMITADPGMKEILAKKLGVNYYIEKPFRIETIRAILEVYSI